MGMSYPSCETIRDYFDYDPLTGHVTHRRKRSRKTVPGARAGHATRPGDHRAIGIDGVLYPEHRIIWIWVHGTLDPAMDVDHENRVRDDNRLENLRLATRAENLWNGRLLDSNTSGVKGVSYSTRDRRWVVQVMCRGVRHGSYHETKEQAIEAVARLRNELHGSFASSGV
jgi:hypothetical protein